MKKIFVLGAVMVLLSAAASAQVSSRNHDLRHREITRSERFDLRKDGHRYDRLRHKAHRDGRVTPMERKRLQKARRYDRMKAYRYRHNGRRRTI